MAKFTQMAPAQAGTTDRSSSGKRRSRRAGGGPGAATGAAATPSAPPGAEVPTTRGGPFGGRFFVSGIGRTHRGFGVETIATPLARCTWRWV
jgi:hypothetical protein